MRKKLVLMLCVMLASAVANAGSATFFSKATASSSDSSRGKVYISNAPAASPEYAAECTAENSKEESGSTSKPTSGTHTYYLYAQAEPGYDFYQWTSGGKVVGTSPECTVDMTATGADAANPTLVSYVASFIVHPYVSVVSDGKGIVEIDKPENNIGDVVTVKARAPYNLSNTSIMPTDVPNRAYRFTGWTDGNGNLVSMDQTYTFTVEKEMVLKAGFELEPGITASEGYYRVMSGWGAALRVSGDFSVNLTGQEQFYGDLDLIRNPEGRGYGYSNHMSNCRYNGDPHNNIYSDPGTIVYMTGVLNEANAASWNKDQSVLTKAVITGQGTGTKTFLGNYDVTVKWHANAGYYTVKCSVGALKFQENASRWAGGDVLYPGRDDNSSQTMLRFEPVDAGHADRYWFGMFPYEEMAFEGGYWTSLYTAFPYRTHEEDGVEVYIIEDISAGNGENLAVLRKIDSGVVPANTAVLLKCRDLIDTDKYIRFNEKGQSLIAQGQAEMPQPANRLIPLHPDDPSIDGSVFAGNMLRGTCQLNHAYPDKENPDKDLGHEKFDGATMRAFSVNGAGQIGFYAIADGADLAPNKAWLDVSSLTPEQRAGSFRIVSENEAGIVDISACEAAEPEYFTLQGVKVSQPQPGHIYVVRRGSNVTKQLVK